MFDIALVTEDVLGMAVAERVIAGSRRRFSVTRRLVERGINNIQRSMTKYRQASHVVPHVVLADLDRIECAPRLLDNWGASNLPANMMLRIAVRETEAWVLGDRLGFAAFAAIAANKIPQQPEELADPKETLITLVRASRRRRLVQEVMPVQGSAVPIGPLYNERLTAFVSSAWDIDSATAACPSLRRMRDRLEAFLTD